MTCTTIQPRDLRHTITPDRPGSAACGIDGRDNDHRERSTARAMISTAFTIAQTRLHVEINALKLEMK